MLWTIELGMCILSCARFGERPGTMVRFVRKVRFRRIRRIYGVEQEHGFNHFGFHHDFPDLL